MRTIILAASLVAAFAAPSFARSHHVRATSVASISDVRGLPLGTESSNGTGFGPTLTGGPSGGLPNTR